MVVLSNERIGTSACLIRLHNEMSHQDMSHRKSEPEQRLPVVMVECPHPALLDPDQLLESCDLRTQRRSGPGGQHRNKTSSGVFLHHAPTNTIAEATERRSQADNRRIIGTPETEVGH